MKHIICDIALLVVLIFGLLIISIQNQVRDKKIQALETNVSIISDNVLNIQYYLEHKPDTIVVQINKSKK